MSTADRPSAETLRPYRGHWVALRSGRVVDSRETPQTLINALGAAGVTDATLVYVPLDPNVDPPVEDR